MLNFLPSHLLNAVLEEGIASMAYVQTTPPSTTCAFQGYPITFDNKRLTYSYRCVSTRT